jgi:aminoglycoside phosphotransferase (APT) family kinase protein
VRTARHRENEETPSAVAELERTASHDDLIHWVESVAGGKVMSWTQISGGNRCQSWTLETTRADGRGHDKFYLRYQPPRPPSAEPYTVLREAEIYRALLGGSIPAAKLIAVNPQLPAILTEHMPGRADFRRISDARERAAIAAQFIEALAALHKLPIENRGFPGLTRGATIADCVRAELRIWRAMYEEAGSSDPLIDLAMNWLTTNVPDVEGKPVLVHGDAGPGNFLFEEGRLTALIDWELAHAGDPLEDLAWFSMRAVMEPVPDFAERIREYGRLSGITPDRTRILYHRVFVTTRVVIIRHRNVTGQPGNSIVSRALNRRLLVAALAAANSVVLAAPSRLDAPATPRTPLYDSVIDEMRDEIVAVSQEPRVVAAAKSAAKVLKYLREVDRFGAVVESQELAALEAVLGSRPSDIAAGRTEMMRALREGRLSFAEVIVFFAASVQRESSLAASASGGLAERTFPSFDEGGIPDV